MKRKMMIALLTVFVLLMNQTVFAYDQSNDEQEKGFVSEKPVEIIDISGDEGEPLGNLTEEELKELRYQLEKEFMDNLRKSLIRKSIKPAHFSLTIHTHMVDTIYNTFNGALDRGEITSGYNPGPGISTLSFSQTLGFSNGWNTSIGFSHQSVTASVGYNVTFSSSSTFSYSMQITEGHTGHIGHQDWYHVQEYTCYTVFFPLFDTYIEYGDGWAQQWYKKHFYSWITPGNSP